jgi:SnoaL-like domain
MSEESPTPDRGELVRCSIEAASRGDLEGAVGIYAPDGVWDMSLPGAGTSVGHSEIRGFFEDWMGAYESYANEFAEEWG